MATTIQNPPPKNPDNDPEDEELSGKQMSFLEHLEELRQRLLRSVISIIVGFGICFYFADKIYGYLAKPLTDTLRALHMSDKLVYTNPIDPFNLYIKLAAMAGIFVASPYILYQLWLFISPGLYRHEKRYIWPFVDADKWLVHFRRTLCLQAGFPPGFAIPADSSATDSNRW